MISLTPESTLSNQGNGHKNTPRKRPTARRDRCNRYRHQNGGSQKFSNYRVRLAIVGDFSPYSSPSFNDFVFENNKPEPINFIGSLTEAVDKLIKP
nr:DUF4180 domain-containing protein [Fibrisoma montanum]